MDSRHHQAWQWDRLTKAILVSLCFTRRPSRERHRLTANSRQRRSTGAPHVYSDNMINTTLLLNSRPAYMRSRDRPPRYKERRVPLHWWRVFRGRKFFQTQSPFPISTREKRLDSANGVNGLHAHLIETEVEDCLMKKHPVHRLANRLRENESSSETVPPFRATLVAITIGSILCSDGKA
ncbi:hypothetical protein C8R44DRAFT_741193 [Mycena epipterygia]|nr:hypothetical protein C8R44DRAFT_741193 [Mycena epipterygia]